MSWSKVGPLIFVMIILSLMLLNYRKRHSFKNKLSYFDEENYYEEQESSRSIDITTERRQSSTSSSWVNLQLLDCGCTKRILTAVPPVDDGKGSSRMTTCGQEANARGSGQKVAAFTFFVSSVVKQDRNYFGGISLNAAAIEKLYPDFVMRVYHNISSSSSKTLCELECRFPNLDFCNVTDNPGLGNLNEILPTAWRFVVMLDDQVDLAIFRDLDSVVSKRESEAVKFWLKSKHAVHIMRDHPGHEMPILAGMWGIKVKALRKSLRLILNQMLQDPLSRSNFLSSSDDQFLLGKYIWPWSKDRSVQHDSFFCTYFGRAKPWPTQRPLGEVNNFVGSPFALNSSLAVACPERCRPRDHKDWVFC